MRFFAGVAIGLSLLLGGAARAQTLPPCGDQRPTAINTIWAGAGDLWCVERVIDDPTIGAIGFTQITAVPSGELYALLPTQRQVARISDSDGDALPDDVTIILTDIPRPTGITYANDTLYIAGNNFIYRYSLTADRLRLLADDLPYGLTGYPSGGLAVHDGWLYVGAGGDVACTPGRGAIYRYNLRDGSRELVASGLRSPADLAVIDDQLWVVDTATDRLLAVESGADYGACGATPPRSEVERGYHFPVGSAPLALAVYASDQFPLLTDRLLVGLRGNVGEVIIAGYQVVALAMDADHPPTDPEPVIPRNAPHLGIPDQRMHIQGWGFYPRHVYGVAVDERGWVYVSAGSGQIVALRPL